MRDAGEGLTVPVLKDVKVACAALMYAAARGVVKLIVRVADVSNDPTLAVVVSKTNAFAGRRHPTNRRWFGSSSAIGKFAFAPTTGHVAITFIAVRSTTAI